MGKKKLIKEGIWQYSKDQMNQPLNLMQDMKELQATAFSLLYIYTQYNYIILLRYGGSNKVENRSIR